MDPDDRRPGINDASTRRPRAISVPIGPWDWLCSTRQTSRFGGASRVSDGIRTRDRRDHNPKDLVGPAPLVPRLLGSRPLELVPLVFRLVHELVHGTKGIARHLPGWKRLVSGMRRVRPRVAQLPSPGKASVSIGVRQSAAIRRGCCVKGAGGRVGVDGAGCARRSPVGSGAGFSVFQMAVAASLCLWSFSRLWVAVIRRHSERAADLPRRWKRSIRRLNLVLANTGSIIALRFA